MTAFIPGRRTQLRALHTGIALHTHHFPFSRCARHCACLLVLLPTTALRGNLRLQGKKQILMWDNWPVVRAPGWSDPKDHALGFVGEWFCVLATQQHYLESTQWMLVAGPHPKPIGSD